MATQSRASAMPGIDGEKRMQQHIPSSVVTLGKKLHVGAEAGAQGETSYPPSPLHQFFLTKPIKIGNALIHRHGPH